MKNNNLPLWIAQSESWQTFIDFNLPIDSIANYPFLKRSDDFYISLFGKTYEILENPVEYKNIILSIAKGLELFSLKTKKDKFYGVNQFNNLLFAAGLYYLANYSASAYILTKFYDLNNYENEIEKFIFCFLRRELDKSNIYCKLLNDYFETGDDNFISNLLQRIKHQKDVAFSENPLEYSVFFLAETILKKFSSNNIWTDLLKYNTVEHWQPYILISSTKSFPIWDFFPTQKLALEKGILSLNQSISLQTPTSSGKTAICELLVYNEFKNNPNCKILFLAPFRALAVELKKSLCKKLSIFGVTSKTLYGGNIPTYSEKILSQNVNLLVGTPEMIIALENTISDFFKDFNIVICDEGHLIEDDNRGLNYELLLSRIKRVNGDKTKFIFISAIIPNINKINAWLGGTNETIVSSTYRATEIEYAFLEPSNSAKSSFSLNVNPYKRIPYKYTLSKILTKNDFEYIDRKKSKKIQKFYSFDTYKTKSVAIALKSLNSGTVALFTPSKGKRNGVIGMAIELMNLLKLGLNLPNPIDYVNSSNNIIDNLKEYFRRIFGNGYTLTQLVEYGALFHHGDLPQFVREIIEDAIRKEDIKLVICTNTLTEGINLPIRTIVIYSARRYDGSGQKNIPIRDLKNLVGRAGRAGCETKGLIIVVNKNDFPIIKNVINDSNIEDVTGFLFIVIREITKVVKDKRLILSNEILESQDERFKELLDSIDISIIDLLSEETKSEELQANLQELIDETFARFQANNEQIQTLNTILKLRGQRIIPFLENMEFKYIKQSGLNIRCYNEIKDNLDLNNSIWYDLKDPICDTWFDFLILNKILKLSTISYKISEFNNRNKTSFSYLEIKNIIFMWLNGYWFEDISLKCACSIDVSLKAVNNLICYHIQSAIASLIKNVELRFENNNNVTISQTVLNYPLYILYGLNTQLQLDLVEIGFSDRIGIIELSKVLNEIEYSYEKLDQLKRFLQNHKDILLEKLDNRVPKITYKKINETFELLTSNI